MDEIEEIIQKTHLGRAFCIFDRASSQPRVPFYNNARKKNRRRLHIRILNGEQKNADPEYDTTLNSSNNNCANDDNK